MRRNGRFDSCLSRTALVLCVIIHVALFLLLRDALRAPTLPPAEIPIAVNLIDATISAPPPLPQPVPFQSRRVTTTLTTSVPHENPVVPAAAINVPAVPTMPTATLPNAQQLLDSVPRTAAEMTQGFAPTDRGFLTHRKAKLPSSNQAVVAGIELRKQVSLNNIVQGVTKGLHDAFACGSMKNDPLSSEKVIASPIVAMMDSHFDIGPDNEECKPEN